MRSEGYRRLHQVCLDMAQQSEPPAARARWLKVAQAWLDRSRDVDDVRPSNGTPLSLDCPRSASVSPKSFMLRE
jgi:hypothetical protein